MQTLGIRHLYIFLLLFFQLFAFLSAMKIVTKAKGTIDFKKKTVKVGKKLKPANETKISVKSKTIYIANHGEEKGSLSFQSQLEKQLQFLTHHASKTREVAIENISQMVEKGQVLDTYVPILITSVMDVLQDEEPKVRSAILALFSTLCVMFSRDVFAACSGIIVTYVCSGLTSLNKVNFFFVFETFADVRVH